MQKKISFIITAAGAGKRLGARVNKTLLKINNKSILEINIENCIKHHQISEIIISYHPNDLESYRGIVDLFQSNNRFAEKTIKLVKGGKERHHSVFNALKEVDESSEYVMIHDGARPFFPCEVFHRFLSEISEGKEAIIPYLPAYDTTLYVNKASDGDDFYLSKSDLRTLDRDLILSVQTPQCFSKRLTNKLIKTMGDSERIYTDESSVLLKSNERIQFIEGSKYLHKITNMNDYEVAKATYKIYLEKEKKYVDDMEK